MDAAEALHQAGSAAEAGQAGPGEGEPGDGLTRREREILAFERQWWKYAGAKEQAIRDLFDMSATRYYQVLNSLIDRQEALAADAMLVNRRRRGRRIAADSPASASRRPGMAGRSARGPAGRRRLRARRHRAADPRPGHVAWKAGRRAPAGRGPDHLRVADRPARHADANRHADHPAVSDPAARDPDPPHAATADHPAARPGTPVPADRATQHRAGRPGRGGGRPVLRRRLAGRPGRQLRRTDPQHDGLLRTGGHRPAAVRPDAGQPVSRDPPGDAALLRTAANAPRPGRRHHSGLDPLSPGGRTPAVPGRTPSDLASVTVRRRSDYRRTLMGDGTASLAYPFGWCC